MAKKICVICEKELGVLSAKVAISDGVVCAECLKRAGIRTMVNGQAFNALSLKGLLIRRAQVIDLFSATKKVGTYIAIDETHRSFKIGSDIFEYANLLSFELMEDGHTITKGGIGSAVVGGLLFGGIGAVVGGVTGAKKTKGVCSSMKLRVSLKNAHIDNVYIPFIMTETKKNSIIYKAAQTSAQSCIAALENILDQNQCASKERMIAQTNNSVADEIIKFKQLLDAGVITKEEFDAKKKQLLGL